MFSQIAANIPAFLEALFSLEMVIALAVGLGGGLVIGALPGLGPTLGIALLLPMTYRMSPIPAITMLTALYTAATTGGSFSSILIATPGTASNAATLLDGYPMASRGEAQRALNISLWSSSFGGFMSALAMLLLAPILAKLTILFNSPEYFLLAILGLSLIVSFSDDGMAKGFIMGCFGLLIATVGTPPGSAYLRYTFGLRDFDSGVRTLPILLGMFAIPQVISNVKKIMANKNKAISKEDIIDVKGQTLFLSKKDTLRILPTNLYCSVLGVLVGILPGAGANIASFIAYQQAKSRSKHPEEFGKGCPEGIAAPETANNAVTGGAMIPTLTLGIPGSPTAAILLSGFMIQGLIPGSSTLFTTQSSITYPIIFGFILANLLMYPVGVWFVKVFKNVIRIPDAVLNACVVVLVMLGTYAAATRPIDLIVALVFGIFGYFCKTAKFATTGFILGRLLGSLCEEGYQRSLVLAMGKAKGNVLLFYTSRPLCLILVICIFLTVCGGPLSRYISKKIKAKKAVENA